MIIKTWRDPYDSGFNTIKPKEIEITEGLTVLVGCNGAGKTTLLMNIKEECKKAGIPCHRYNNLNDGGTGGIAGILGGVTELPCDNLGLAASIWTASEGEPIKLNIGRQSTLYKEFIKTGYFKNRDYRFSKIFKEDKSDAEISTDIRVFLFDATDSGLSIDSICDIKKLFEMILDESSKKGIQTYIIISANEYELCRGENCFDVNDGKYLTFKDYEDYRKFILKSRQKKEKRIEKQIKWREKELAKEKEQYLKLKKTNLAKISDIESKGELTWSDRSNIDSLRRAIDDYMRSSRFLTEKDVEEVERVVK